MCSPCTFRRPDAQSVGLQPLPFPARRSRGGTAGHCRSISPALRAPWRFGTDGQLTSTRLSETPIGLAIPGLTSGAADLHLEWNPFNDSGSRAHHAVRPTFGAVCRSSQNGSAAPQLIRVGLADQWQDSGTVLRTASRWWSVRCCHGQRAQPRIADRLRATTTTMASARTATRGDRTCPSTGGRGDIVGGAIESSTVDIAKRVHQSDRPAARLPGQFARDHHGGRAQPGNHQPEAARQSPISLSGTRRKTLNLSPRTADHFRKNDDASGRNCAARRRASRYSKSNSIRRLDDNARSAAARRGCVIGTSRSAGENIDIYIGGVLCGSG